MNNFKETNIPSSAKLLKQSAQSLPAPPRRGLLVLGMHRSGTSALTGMLGKLGCVLPSDLLGAGIGNEKGHWEAKGAVAVNDRILSNAGSNWEDWTRFNPAWYASPFYSGALQEVKESIRTSFGTAPLFVLKDPRICRLLPIWLSALEAEGIEPAIVICMRSPGQVAASLESRDGMDRGYAYLLWLRHTLEAEVGTRGKKRVICDFRQLKKDWRSLAFRIGAELEIAWPRQSASARQDIDSFLAPPPQITAAATPHLDVMPLAERVFAILGRWSNRGEDHADYSEMDEIFREFESAAEIFASLILPGSRSLGAGGGHAMRNALEQASNALAQVQTETSARLSEYEAVIRALEARLAAAETAKVGESKLLVERGDQVAGLKSELDALSRTLANQQTEHDQQIHKYTHAAKDLAHQQALAESTLRRLEEEIAQTRDERDEALKAAARLPSMRNKLEVARTDSLRSAAKCQSAQAMVARLQRLTQELQQQLTAELALRGRIEQDVLTLKAQAAEREGDLHQLQTRLDMELTEKERLRQTVVAVRSEVVRLEAGKAEAIQSSLQEAAMRSAEKRVAADRHQGEIEHMARRLTQAEENALAAARNQEWLAQVSAALLDLPRWWSFMPAAWRQQREQDVLAQHRLFNARAYLNLNPDVAAAGVDPVRHYLSHGIVEGRTLTR